MSAVPRPPHRRYVILTDGFLADRHHAKTAHGVVRYAKDEVVAIVDPTYAGMRLADVVGDLGRDVPIVAGVPEALTFSPTSLVIGVAISGGRMPEQFRRHILAAIDAGLEIVNGLHEFVSDDEEFVAHARASGARLWDVRRVPPDIQLFSGAAYRVPQVVVLAVGSDCSVGKMTVMLELARAARETGDSAEFVATGQTGIMIAGRGIAVDRVIADFIAGACEQLVLSVDPTVRFTLVEGQGSILHPAFAPVTYGLLLGAAPDLLVLCHEVGRDHIDGYDVPIPDLRTLARLYEAAVEPVKPAPCVAVALNTAAVGEEQARAAIRRAREATGLPVDDPLRFGAADLWQAVRTAARRTAKHKEAATAS